jgi:hypothetical protein
MSLFQLMLIGVVSLLGAAPPGDVPAVQGPGDPATFVHRLAGEWSVVSEAVPGPGQNPVRTERRETARLIDRWLVAESTGEVGEQPFTSILTLGYDAVEERFVATFIDSMQAHLWLYHGALDEAGAALTLDTEGPIFGDPARTARYRVIIEDVGADHRVMRSLIVGPDGEWFEFARSEYSRIG